MHHIFPEFFINFSDWLVRTPKGQVWVFVESAKKNHNTDAFKESTYDEVSIWKFAVVKNKKGKSAKDNKVEAIEKEIKKLRSDMNSMIGNLHNELDIQELKSTFENF